MLFAARQNDLESTKILLAAGADIKETAARTASHPAFGRNPERPLRAREFPARKGEPIRNAADSKGRAALLYAAVDMRNLEWSTRPAPPDKDSMTELDLIKALLAHGANPNARLTKKIRVAGPACV